MAIIIPALPYTLTNGTTADANQVMADLNDIVSGVNTNGAANGPNSDITSLTGLTTPLAASQGGTGIAAPGSSKNILQSNGSGLWQATPLLGVTDGSNAAAGQIGEYVVATQSSASIASGVWTNIISMALGAGDWDVWGQANWTSAGPYSYLAAGVATASASPGPSPSVLNYTSAVLAAGVQLPLSTVRMSSSTSFNAYLSMTQTSGGICNIAANLFARRVR
jgi:hypothetical protein